LTRFEKSIAVAGPLIAAGGLWLGIANYKHTVQHDQQQQIDDMMKASTRPPTTTLPNLNRNPVETPTEQQTNKEPDKPVQQPQQKATDSPPPETTPKEAPKKEEPKPFTFWGYFQSGQQLRPGIMFQVNSCHVGKTLVTCSRKL
jgi:outer membrane biosynthesis protein TonB